MTKHYIGWYNVENLFDVEDSGHRSEFLKRRLARELEGWDRKVLSRKVAQLASVIGRMNGSAGPDILGVCEVENEPVLELLARAVGDHVSGRDYKVVHAASADPRGIDVAFLYDARAFEAGESFTHRVVKRRATRDILQVNFYSRKSDQVLVVVGNHWPSRSGGEQASEPYRIVAGETLAYWMTRIPEALGDPDVPVVVMGDFNDDPFDRALRDYALSTRSVRKVLMARTAPRLLNLMWPLMGDEATFYFNNFPFMLDQFMVSKGLLDERSAFSVRPDSVEVICDDDMVEGSYRVPRRFGRPSRSMDHDGFSDHFPIGLVLHER